MIINANDNNDFKHIVISAPCQIKAADNGNPQKWSTTSLNIEWIRKPLPSTSPLLFTAPYFNFSIPENAKVSETVGTVSVHQNTIPLWFDITGELH